jgi:co-chaperonin GroES (HSP10)
MPATLADHLTHAILQTDIPSLANERVRVRPTADNVLVERQSDERTFKGIVLPFSDRISCQVARVLAVGPKTETVRPGQDVLFVRSIGRRVDDRELRSSDNRKVWLMGESDVVATVDESDGRLRPTGQRVLVKVEDGRRELPSGLVVMQNDTLLVVVSQVRDVGPKCSGEIKVGDHVIHHKIEPLRIDDPWLVDRFGSHLAILGKETMCRAVVEYEFGEEGRVRIEGHGYPEKVNQS